MIKRDHSIVVSVVMPVHNGERFLKEAIESVLCQTYKNFEFIIVENCSTDSSLQIINSFKDHRIKLIIENECGIVQAYNRGFKEAKGEYIIIHDHDDISMPTRLESQLNFAIKNKLDICGSSFEIINESGEFVKHISPPINKYLIFERSFYDSFVLFNPTLIIKKKILINLNYFDVNLPIGSDYDFIMRVMRSCNFGNNIENIVKYRFHLKSTSKSNEKKRKHFLRKISEKYFQIYYDRLEDPFYSFSLINYYYGSHIQSIFYMLKSIIKNGPNREKMRYLILSSVFAIPLEILRKHHLFFNKKFNYLINTNK